MQPRESFFVVSFLVFLLFYLMSAVFFTSFPFICFPSFFVSFFSPLTIPHSLPFFIIPLFLTNLSLIPFFPYLSILHLVPICHSLPSALVPYPSFHPSHPSHPVSVAPCPPSLPPTPQPLAYHPSHNIIFPSLLKFHRQGRMQSTTTTT